MSRYGGNTRGPAGPASAWGMGVGGDSTSQITWGFSVFGFLMLIHPNLGSRNQCVGEGQEASGLMGCPVSGAGAPKGYQPLGDGRKHNIRAIKKLNSSFPTAVGLPLIPNVLYQEKGTNKPRKEQQEGERGPQPGPRREHGGSGWAGSVVPTQDVLSHAIWSRASGILCCLGSDRPPALWHPGSGGL